MCKASNGEELLKLRLEAEPEEGQKEAEGAHDQPGKENVPVKEGGPVAAAEGDGELPVCCQTT